MRRERYTVLQKIAAGGMAEIYLGTQHGAEGFARPIVIKRIRRGLSDPKFRDMLVDEAHIAMTLVHSNIVQVLDLGTAQGSDFLVLELVDGWDLQELRARSEASAIPLPPELALHVMAEVCRGLAFAHTKRRDGTPLGIVHRDISPHNILVSEAGEVKLADFGIATALEKREHTQAGVVKGKLGFMSPEQAAGAALDHRSDLFSVGTTLYLLATGRRPYSGSTDLEVLLKMREAEFPPPEVARPDLAPELAALIRKAMQKDPAARYQSAEELLVALEQVQRAVYPPASQTELKRWLARLAERDGSLPISLRPPKVTVPPSKGDLPKGASLVLQEVEPDAVLTTGGHVVPNPTAGRTLPGGPGAHGPWRVLPAVASALIVGAVFSAFWLRATGQWASAPAEPDAGLVLTAVPDEPEVAYVTAPGLDAGRPAEPTQEAAPEPAKADDEEEDLDVVSVRFVSDPPGASLTILKQTFGNTPIGVRVRSELTYDVTFQKSGYRSFDKRVHVQRRKGQTVQVKLEKKGWLF